MRFLHFRSGDEKHYDKAKKRLDRQTQTTTVLWADSGVWAVQSALDAYKSTSDKAALAEARTGAVGLLAAIDSLLDRKR